MVGLYIPISVYLDDQPVDRPVDPSLVLEGEILPAARETNGLGSYPRNGVYEGVTQMKAVVFLQNAWSPVYAGGTWPRKSWLKALENSRSGQRLSILNAGCPSVELWYDNTTPIVGAEPNSQEPADLSHMVQVLVDQRPDYVVVCGRQAAAAITEIDHGCKGVLVVPHPAYRVLTNSLYETAASFLEGGFIGTIELTQGREAIRMVRNFLPAVSPTFVEASA